MMKWRCERLHTDLELECFRGMETERKRWETREERLVEQVCELRAAQQPVREPIVTPRSAQLLVSPRATSHPDATATSSAPRA